MTNSEQFKPARDPHRERGREFSTIDLLLLIVLVGGIGSVFGAVLAQAFQDQRPLRAKMVADTLTHQIEARWLEDANAPNPRTPSSTNPVSSEIKPERLDLTEGTIGKDPWGRPFHYSVRDHQIFVWSDGLNGKSESTSSPSFALQGDDVGSVRRLRIAHH